MSTNKRIRVFAGPNGSGKSTLFNEVKNYFSKIPFINADELEKILSESGKKHELIAEMLSGKLQLKVNKPPNWFKTSVLKYLID